MASKSIDNAFTAKSLRGAATDPTYAGVLSFMASFNDFEGIPAHVNREENGLLPRLGGVPPELNLSIMEIFNISKSEAIRQYPFLKDFHLIPSSDAHDLEAIKGIIHIEMDKVSVSALQSALQAQY